MPPMKHISIDPSNPKPPTRDHPAGTKLSSSLPVAKETKVHPTKAGDENASLTFIGTATTILCGLIPSSLQHKSLTNTHCREWEGIRLMTDVGHQSSL